jgi:hypothetical protein
MLQIYAPSRSRYPNSPSRSCVLCQHLSELWLENKFDAIAKTLTLLHDMPLFATLRQSPMGSDQISAKRREILKNCPTGRAKNLVDLQPDHQVKQTDHLQLFMQIQFPQTLSYLMAWQVD